MPIETPFGSVPGRIYNNKLLPVFKFFLKFVEDMDSLEGI